jgi:hypothetical protein
VSALATAQAAMLNRMMACNSMLQMQPPFFTPPGLSMVPAMNFLPATAPAPAPGPINDANTMKAVMMFNFMRSLFLS